MDKLSMFYPFLIGYFVYKSHTKVNGVIIAIICNSNSTINGSNTIFCDCFSTFV